MSLRIGVPELIVALDAAPELYSVVHDHRLWCRFLPSRLPSLDFGNHVPYRLRREVVVSQK